MKQHTIIRTDRDKQDFCLSFSKSKINPQKPIVVNIDYFYKKNSNQQLRAYWRLIKVCKVFMNNLGNNFTDEDDLLLDYKAYKNYNLHLRINKKFMKAFNIEASRLFGWVKNKEDILNEFPESNDKEYRFTGDDVDRFFKTNLKIEANASNVLMIGN